MFPDISVDHSTHTSWTCFLFQVVCQILHHHRQELPLLAHTRLVEQEAAHAGEALDGAPFEVFNCEWRDVAAVVQHVEEERFPGVGTPTMFDL